MQTILRGLGYFGLALLVIVLGLLGYALYDINAGTSATELTNIAIEAEDGTLNAYLAEPAGDGPFPAVLLIHEWWGLRPDIITKADTLAEAGYVVLAVDAYRGRVATSIPGAIINTLNYPQDRIDADMRVFHNHLSQLDQVAADQIAVMGFCFGGRQSVLFAVNNPAAIRAVLTYYGGGQPNTETDLQPLADTDIRVLGVFGEQDESIPLADVEQFERALDALNVPVAIEIYAGVGHAFVKDLTGDSTSAQAWQRGLAFLDETLAG
jgi:carboxymethylenebutenolidase